MITARELLSAEQFFALPGDGPYELIGGEVIELPPPGEDHGYVQSNLTAILRDFARSSGSGRSMVEVGFILRRSPDTVLLPDVAFLKTNRPRKRGFVEGAPDLAVEVLSPSNTNSEIALKVSRYLETGGEQVWVIDPDQKTVTVYVRGREPMIHPESAELTGGDLLPGFSCKVSELFE